MHLNLDVKPCLSSKQQQNTSVSKTAQERTTESCCCILQAKSICAEDGAEITAPDVAELEMKKQRESAARQKH